MWWWTFICKLIQWCKFICFHQNSFTNNCNNIYFKTCKRFTWWWPLWEIKNSMNFWMDYLQMIHMHKQLFIPILFSEGFLKLFTWTSFGLKRSKTFHEMLPHKHNECWSASGNFQEIIPSHWTQEWKCADIKVLMYSIASFINMPQSNPTEPTERMS